MSQWTATERDPAGRARAYRYRETNWSIHAQPFTPIWHIRYKGRFVKDCPRVSEAKRIVALACERGLEAPY